MSLRRPSFEDADSGREINISPLIDVMFILLIFFIVTMVFSEKSGMPIERPKSSEARNIEEGAMNVFVDRSGRISVGGLEVGIPALRDAARLNRSKAAVIDSDGAVGVSRIVEIMDACSQGGVERIFIASDKAGGNPL